MENDKHKMYIPGYGYTGIDVYKCASISEMCPPLQLTRPPIGFQIQSSGAQPDFIVWKVGTCISSVYQLLEQCLGVQYSLQVKKIKKFYLFKFG